ncbi:IclR family transcriptional regulator [Brevibacterium aurantiacum]|uniref:HTH iclR-type domain-containing protein n=1 Tax=Brevibacterium aurantiacum TaxID=273384 RepID=A0A2A3Z1L6_BREAU|nr:helix-turn-helix domain-containing protein [Brevibacterium aurantiacum]PCC45510.1 hypothetical protein CIK64_15355 [Brevibacterium aurantiacum]
MEKGLSKTLDNGLRALAVVARHPSGMSIQSLSEYLQLHRTVVHRLVKTLEVHRLLHRDSSSKRLFPGLGLVWLAASVQGELQSLAKPVLEDLSSSTGATSYLVSEETENEVVAILVVEPLNAKAHVAFRAGQRHAADRGSAGIALQAGKAPKLGERDAVRRARELGYSVSHSEVISSTVGIAAAIPSDKLVPSACIGVSVFDDSLAESFGAEVSDAAARLGAAIDGAL